MDSLFLSVLFPLIAFMVPDYLCSNTRGLASLLLLLLAGFSLRAQPTAGGSHVVSSSARPIQDNLFRLEQNVLAADGSSQQVSLVLPKLYALAASAQSGTRNLYVLRKQWSDSTALLLTDSLGRVLRLARMVFAGTRTATLPLPPPQLVSLLAGRGFVLMVPTKKSCRLLCLAPDLSTRWAIELPAHPILQALASETHLWVVQQKLLTQATPLPLVHTLNLSNGEFTYDGSLQLKDALEAAALVPEGLLLLGHSDDQHVRKLPAGQAVPRTKRIDFMLIIKPNGQRQVAQSLVWPDGQRPAFHWQGAYPLPNGGYQLIGQLVRHTPNVAAFLFSAISVGTFFWGGPFYLIAFGGYTNERPAGLLMAQLRPDGLLADVHTLAKAPVTLTAKQLLADSTIADSTRTTAFRPVGLSPDHRFLVLNTDRQVLLYEPARRELRPLVAARAARPTVLAIEPGRALVGWAWQPDRTLPDFEWVTWP